MNEIDSKAEHVRKLREKFDHTWSEIKPKLTIYGLVDETVGQMIKKRRSDALVTAVAVAGAAWLFNSFEASRNLFKFSKSKTVLSKQETEDHENSSTIRRNNQT